MGERNGWRAVKVRHDLREVLLNSIKSLQIARGTSNDFAALDQAMKDKHSSEIPRVFQTVAPHLELILSTSTILQRAF